MIVTELNPTQNYLRNKIPMKQLTTRAGAIVSSRTSSSSSRVFTVLSRSHGRGTCRLPVLLLLLARLLFTRVTTGWTWVVLPRGAYRNVVSCRDAPLPFSSLVHDVATDAADLRAHKRRQEFDRRPHTSVINGRTIATAPAIAPPTA